MGSVGLVLTREKSKEVPKALRIGLMRNNVECVPKRVHASGREIFGRQPGRAGRKMNKDVVVRPLFMQTDFEEQSQNN